MSLLKPNIHWILLKKQWPFLNKNSETNQLSNLQRFNKLFQLMLKEKKSEWDNNSRYVLYLKKEGPLDKANYRPISILPTILKIF